MIKNVKLLRVTAFSAMCVLATSAHSEILVGLNNANTLLNFDSAAATNSTNVAISGLALNERIISVDFRNPDNQIYGLSSLGNLYKLNSITGAATQVATNVVPAVGVGSIASYEIDFNTQNNNLRIIGNSAAPNSNSALNIATSSNAVQSPLTRAGGTLNVVGAAYNQNFSGSPAATLNLYYLDAESDALYFNNNAFAGGVLTKVGDLTLNGNLFDINGPTGFEIAPSGNAFVSFRENLYLINLSSGALSIAGQFGTTPGNIIGLTSAATVPLPASFLLTLGGLGLLGLSKRFGKQKYAI